VRLPAEWGTSFLVSSSDDVAMVTIDDGGSFIAVGAETAVWLKS
jgi:hypothetical protein